MNVEDKVLFENLGQLVFEKLKLHTALVKSLEREKALENLVRNLEEKIKGLTPLSSVES